MEFVNVVRSLGVARKHSKHNDDLFVDRLNHRYTVVIILLFAIVVTASQYGGNPINCWVPGHFTGNYATYTDNICWVSSTYNIPLTEDLPNDETDRKIKLLKYYQWTPFILLFQALLFYLPRMIWRSLNDKSGLDIQSIVDAVYNCYSDQSKFEDREKLLNYVTNSLDFYINSVKLSNQEASDDRHGNFQLGGDNEGPARRRNIYSEKEKKAHFAETDENQSDNEYTDQDALDNYPPKTKKDHFLASMRRVYRIFCITKGKRYGNYLLALFVIVKLLYTINSIVQLFILNHFLGNDFLLLGFEVLNKIWIGDDWTQLKRFPRVTMCDFRIREVGIVHRYTVQCVLSINLFNEKIFIFLWFWLCLVSIFNIIDLLSWSYTLILNGHERYTYIKRRLTVLNSPTNDKSVNFANSNDRFLFNKFVNSYLREDVLLALRLLSRNSQDLIVSEIVANLYNLYKNKQKEHQHQQRAFNLPKSIVKDVDETNFHHFQPSEKSLPSHSKESNNK